MSRLTVAWVTSKPRADRCPTSSPWLAIERASTSRRIAACRSRLGSMAAPLSRGARAGPGADARAEARVVERAGEGVSAEPSAMIASASSQASAERAALTLGTMPPAIVPSSMSASASSGVIVSSFVPSLPRTPSTSVIRTSWRRAEPGGDARPRRRRR